MVWVDIGRETEYILDSLPIPSQGHTETNKTNNHSSQQFCHWLKRNNSNDGPSCMYILCWWNVILCCVLIKCTFCQIFMSRVSMVTIPCACLFYVLPKQQKNELIAWCYFAGVDTKITSVGISVKSTGLVYLILQVIYIYADHDFDTFFSAVCCVSLQASWFICWREPQSFWAVCLSAQLQLLLWPA